MDPLESEMQSLWPNPIVREGVLVGMTHDVPDLLRLIGDGQRAPRRLKHKPYSTPLSPTAQRCHPPLAILKSRWEV